MKALPLLACLACLGFSQPGRASAASHGSAPQSVGEAAAADAPSLLGKVDNLRGLKVAGVATLIGLAIGQLRTEPAPRRKSRKTGF